MVFVLMTAVRPTDPTARRLQATSMARPPRRDRTSVGECTLSLRLTAEDRALLDELVAERADELCDEGMRPTAASFVRGLIRREARARGVRTSSRS
jgi:hypothetical protein